MTPLKKILIEEISANGPMQLADYMARALSDPEHGYYMQRRPFGTRGDDGGDFITAPEVSQMFGELIGAWLADLWHRMGQPQDFCLVELGPGRGTLMGDILRAANVLPDFIKAAQMHFVETSPTLRAAQKQAVPHATWHDDVTTLPAAPTLLVANEFFDALPVQQYRKQGNDWLPVMVTAVTITGNQSLPCLRYCCTGKASKNSLATNRVGAAGRVVTSSCQVACGTACFCAARKVGLVSTKCICAAFMKSGSTLAARKISPISVPRPGPNSTKQKSCGCPMRCHKSANHAPINSPNIWLTSGAVMKSPPSSPRVPKGRRCM